MIPRKYFFLFSQEEEKVLEQQTDEIKEALEELNAIMSSLETGTIKRHIFIWLSRGDILLLNFKFAQLQYRLYIILIKECIMHNIYIWIINVIYLYIVSENSKLDKEILDVENVQLPSFEDVDVWQKQNKEMESGHNGKTFLHRY